MIDSTQRLLSASSRALRLTLVRQSLMLSCELSMTSAMRRTSRIAQARASGGVSMAVSSGWRGRRCCAASLGRSGESGAASRAAGPTNGGNTRPGSRLKPANDMSGRAVAVGLRSNAVAPTPMPKAETWLPVERPGHHRTGAPKARRSPVRSIPDARSRRATPPPIAIDKSCPDIAVWRSSALIRIHLSRARRPRSLSARAGTDLDANGHRGSSPTGWDHANRYFQ